MKKSNKAAIEAYPHEMWEMFKEGLKEGKTHNKMSEETQKHFILLATANDELVRSNRTTRMIAWFSLIVNVIMSLVVIYGMILLGDYVPEKLIANLNDYEFIITE